MSAKSEESKPFQGPSDLSLDYEKNLGDPGEYPYTRGIHRSMYTSRLWTMRQYAGFGTAEESNARYRFLLDQGQSGLSVAFDLPTQLGLDSDDPLAEGEVGKVGVAVDTLKDMEILFDGLPIESVSTSFTINAPAAVILAMFIVLAERQGVPPSKLKGTVQNDILKEYIARGTWIFPAEPSIRLAADVIEYCSKHAPRFYPISICGYHIREAGSTAVQELAFTLANALVYVEQALARGLDIDDFAPRLTFFFSASNDIFEEAAKFRAGRRLWARIVRERFNARNPQSWQFRFGIACAGSTLRAEQPSNNIVRVAYEALGAVLGGAQSVFTCAWDEPFAIPSDESAQLALRTQQVLAYETGIAKTVDPLGGSYYIETLTDEIEADVLRLMAWIEKEGGTVKGIENGRIQRLIADEAYAQEKRIQSGEMTVVGVNRFRGNDVTQAFSPYQVSAESQQRQIRRLTDTRNNRDAREVTRALDALEAAARGTDNLMPFLIDAVSQYATIGEITARLYRVFGTFKQPLTI